MFSHVAARSTAVLIAVLSAALSASLTANAQDQGAAEEHATFASRFSALTDPATPPPQPVAPAELTLHSIQAPAAEPFALNVESVTAGGAFTKWTGLVADIRAESEILARCRSDVQHCPAAARKFLAVIADGRAREGRARIGVINRDINMSIRPMSDMAQWGVLDRWSAPLTTLATGRGDCEDYAIAKYVALHEAGVADDDLRLVIVHDLVSGEDHAVTATRVDAKWIMLDNRHLRMVEDTAMPRVLPLFAFDSGGAKRFTLPVAEARRTPEPARSPTTAPSAL